MKKISIIVPVYKVENYLRQCVDSILAQTYANFELILVDDGSPDSCPKICDEYASNDKRIKVIHKNNDGVSEARNSGIEAATGDYIVFLDSDDYWDSNTALERCMRICDKTDTDVLLFGFKKYYQDTNDYETIRMGIPSEECNKLIPIKELLKQNAFVTSPCNKIVKASFFRGPYGIRFVKGQLSEDIEYCAKILLNANKYALLPDNFYIYRKGLNESRSSNINSKDIGDIASIIKKYVSLSSTLENSVPLLNYLSLQYVLWMTVTTLLPYAEIKETIGSMKKLWWITRYNWCPYVRQVSKVRWMGFDIVRRLLGIYKKIK